MFRSTSVVITTTGASPSIELSPVSRPTRPGPVRRDEVAELLVREGFQRGRVEALAAVLEGAVDRVLAHHRLAGTRGGRDQHGLTPVEGLHGRELEVVQGERVALRERPGGGHGPSVGSPAVGSADRGGLGPTTTDRALGDDLERRPAPDRPARRPRRRGPAGRPRSRSGRPASSAPRGASRGPPGRRSGTLAGTSPFESARSRQTSSSPSTSEASGVTFMPPP